MAANTFRLTPPARACRYANGSGERHNHEGKAKGLERPFPELDLMRLAPSVRLSARWPMLAERSTVDIVLTGSTDAEPPRREVARQ